MTDSKCLLLIHKSFKGIDDEELTIEPGQIVQLIRKFDKYWYEVYYDKQIGRIPIDCCHELKNNERFLLENIRITKSQRLYISKHDFINNCEEGDLRFSCNEIIIGFYAVNDDWWNGCRVNSVKRLPTTNQLVVNDSDCGIFPLTYVWELRDDLLPDHMFDEHGICIVNINNDQNIANSINCDSIVEKEVIKTSLNYEDSKKYLYLVKVIKTMEAKLEQEIDLPELNEILGIIKDSDPLYYEGESLSRKIRGIFPKNFVSKINDSDTVAAYNHSNNSSINCSPIPPSFSPPPLPADIFGYPISKNAGFAEHSTYNDDYTKNNAKDEDLPPSYEAAMMNSLGAQPVAYGYANYMFNEMEPYGRVLYDFDAQDNSELSLRRDQIVRLIRHYDSDWMEGEIDGRRGFFPRNYISIIVDCKEQVDQKQNDTKQNDQNQVEAIDFPPNSFAKIIHDFDGEMEQDLKVHTGDVITMLRRFTTTDWIEAKDSSGNVGFVHMNFCQPFENTPTAPTQTDSASASNIYPQLVDVEKEEKIEANNANPPTVSSAEQQIRPVRRAPVLPRDPNYFPTFNQFLIQEKQEHYQFDLDGRETSLNQTGESNMKSQKTHEQNQRECVITELIQTEKDYCFALKICDQVFTSSEFEAKKVNVDIDKLLSNMKNIIDVSKNLLKLFDNYVHNRSYHDQRVGICFLDLKFKIHESYTQYCRNHDSMHTLLKYYEGNKISQSYIKNCLGRIQEQTNCFDLSSMWIKPVQRILKYPLLLNELLKHTENDHVDYEPLKMAIQMITDIATRINEHKRRQDLIEKYCRKKDPTIAEKLRNLSRHSVMKKSTRLKYRILSTIFHASSVIDKDYDAALSSFNEMGKNIRTFVENLKEFLDSLSKFNIEILSTMESFNEYGNFRHHPRFHFEKIREKYLLIYRDLFDKFKKSIENNVIKTLVILLEKFSSPKRLIEKRNDKRLDFEAGLKKFAPNSDNLHVLKNTFDALNQQLLDELPILTSTSMKIFENRIKKFLYEYKHFIGLVAKNQLDLYELPLINNAKFEYFSDIEQTFRIKYNLNFEQMLKDFTLLHTSSFQDASSSSSSTSSFPRFGSKRSSNTWKNAVPIKTIGPNTENQQSFTPSSSSKAEQSSSVNQMQQESHRKILMKKYSAENLYNVLKNYEPCDILEINVNKNDLVGVIKYKEPNGNDNRWYIDRGFVQGFIPKNLLTPFQNQWEQQESTTMEMNRYDEVPIDDIQVETPRYYSTVPIFEYSNLESIPESAKTTAESSKKINELNEFDPLTSTSTFQNNDDDDNHYLAAYPFKSSGSNQLSVHYNEEVRVLCKQDMSGNQEWWLCENKSKQQGYVPANYLKKK